MNCGYVDSLEKVKIEASRSKEEKTFLKQHATAVLTTALASMKFITSTSPTSTIYSTTAPARDTLYVNFTGKLLTLTSAKLSLLKWVTIKSTTNKPSTTTSTFNLYSKIASYSTPLVTSTLTSTMSATYSYTTKIVTIKSNAIPTTVGTGSATITTSTLTGHQISQFPILDTTLKAIDGNSNTIKAQKLLIYLTTSPTGGTSAWTSSKATKTGMGIMGFWLDNTPLYVMVDNDGQNPASLEIQDKYARHPVESGEYHGHLLSPEIINYTLSKLTLSIVGFAIDGWPIVAPFLKSNGTIVANTDLDVCHGILLTGNTLGLPTTVTFPFKVTVGTSVVTTTVSYTYAYVCNLEYPYTIGAFRGTPTTTGTYT